MLQKGDNNENVTHRLKQYIDHKGINIYRFEMSAGLTKNKIHNAINNDTDFGVKTLTTISKNYPELNMDWLVSGRGSMLLGEAAPVAIDGECNVDFKEKYYSVLEKYTAALEENKAEKKSSAVAKVGAKP